MIKTDIYKSKLSLIPYSTLLLFPQINETMITLGQITNYSNNLDIFKS